jgi:hypothetical protein
MRIAPVAFALSALLAVSAARANDISYNHLDVGYAKVDIDDFSEDADGLVLRASFEFAGNFFVFGSYSDLSVDVDVFDVDLTDYEMGLGYAWPVGNSSSLYGKVSYVSAEAETFGFTVDDDGYGVAVGLRTRPAPSLELETYLDYVDLDDSGDDTSVGLAGRYFLSPQFALALEAQFGDDATTYGLGFRWHWGN